MKKYTECTPYGAIDALKEKKMVQWYCQSNNEWLDIEDGIYPDTRYRIVEEVPDPKPPKLSKWAGWMWVFTGQLVILDSNSDEHLETYADRGEIVPPSVWMNNGLPKQGDKT